MTRRLAPAAPGRPVSRDTRPRTGRLAVLFSLSLLLLAGCASAPEAPSIIETGDPVVDGRAQLAVARPQDRVMWEDRIAASALRVGNYAEAEKQLDAAILDMGGIIANDADAKKARSLFAEESRKTFIGEPYERSMAFYYRGILYWRDGQPDNARACFRTAQFIDSDSDEDAYKGDWVLFDYLDGLASEKLSADGSDAYKRAVANSHRHKLPPYDVSKNVLVFAEFGEGPRKYAGGEYGEQLKFQTFNSRVHSAALVVDGKTVRLPAYDDVNFQATTRGGRVMDYILGRKAVFKGTTDTVGDVALVGAAIAANNGSRDSDRAALALGAIGLISKIASAATTPKADTRAWNNLPQRLSFAALKLAPGNHEATLQFFDRSGQVINELTRPVTIQVDEATRDTVVFLSELTR